MMTGEMDSFRWNCKSCISSFPSLENITGVLQEIKATYDGRMTNIESRMDRFEEKTEKVITENVREMKDDIVDSLKGELSLLVDSRCRELDDRKRRELNLKSSICQSIIKEMVKKTESMMSVTFLVYVQT